MTTLRHMLLLETVIVQIWTLHVTIGDTSILSWVFPNIIVDTKTRPSICIICTFGIQTHKFMVSIGLHRISRGMVVSGKALQSICIKLLLVWIFSLTGIAVLTADKVHPVESGIRCTLLQNKLKQLSRSLFRPQHIISVSTNGIASFQWKTKRKDKAG